MSDRPPGPPAPPRRRCDYPGCDKPPFLSKDWCTTCREHNGVPRPTPSPDAATEPSTEAGEPSE